MHPSSLDACSLEDLRRQNVMLHTQLLIFENQHTKARDEWLRKVRECASKTKSAQKRLQHMRALLKLYKRTVSRVR
eukprot:2408928-Rhodomonas_salina.3